MISPLRVWPFTEAEALGGTRHLDVALLFLPPRRSFQPAPRRCDRRGLPRKCPRRFGSGPRLWNGFPRGLALGFGDTQVRRSRESDPRAAQPLADRLPSMEVNRPRDALQMHVAADLTALRDFPLISERVKSFKSPSAVRSAVDLVGGEVVLAVGQMHWTEPVMLLRCTSPCDAVTPMPRQSGCDHIPLARADRHPG